jgi:hypothetical protein
MISNQGKVKAIRRPEYLKATNQLYRRRTQRLYESFENKKARKWMDQEEFH